MLVVLAFTSLSALAESVELHITGTIMPTGCTPALSSGGTVDYGKINPDTLQTNSYNVMGEKYLDLTISCTGPTKVALRAINSDIGSLAIATDDVVASGVTARQNGDTTKVGEYAVRIKQGSTLADSMLVDVLQSQDATASWQLYNNALVFNAGNGRILSWGTSGGSTVPVAFTQLTTKLTVQTYLNKASELDLTKPIMITGLATLELVYL
jgi:type 1 fimbria pilin